MKKLKAIKEEVKQHYELEYCVQQDPYTFVGIKASFGGRIYHGHGFAKRNPKDAPSPRLGEKIAIGRAIQQVARQVLPSRVLNVFNPFADSPHVTIGTPDGGEIFCVRNAERRNDG